jgi:DNA-binding XRE family transcriptional regulator
MTMNIIEVREAVGKLWGLDRSLTKMELARALKLSPTSGGDYVSKLEKGKLTPSGPLEFALEALVDGYVPRHMADVIKPGYPKGAVR